MGWCMSSGGGGRSRLVWTVGLWVMMVWLGGVSLVVVVWTFLSRR